MKYIRRRCIAHTKAEDSPRLRVFCRSIDHQTSQVDYPTGTKSSLLCNSDRHTLTETTRLSDFLYFAHDPDPDPDYFWHAEHLTKFTPLSLYIYCTKHLSVTLNPGSRLRRRSRLKTKSEFSPPPWHYLLFASESSFPSPWHDSKSTSIQKW